MYIKIVEGINFITRDGVAVIGKNVYTQFRKKVLSTDKTNGAALKVGSGTCVSLLIGGSMWFAFVTTNDRLSKI